MKSNLALDEIDREILERLIKNSRVSFRSLAKKLKIGVATVSRRIRMLEKEGVIKQYTTLIDHFKLGKNYLLCCFAQIKSGSDINNLANDISSLEAVQNICYIAGDFELTIIAHCEDQEDATKFISKLSKFPEINRIIPHTIFKQFK